MSNHRALLAGVALLPLSLPAISGAQQRIDRRAASTSAPSVRLEGPIGAIRVIAWKHDSVAVTGLLPDRFLLSGGTTTDPSDRRFTVMANMKLNMNTIPATPSPTESWVELRVPAGARVWVRSVAAVLSVTGVTGGLDLYNVGGSTHVTGAPRQLTIESMEGTVTVEGSPSWLRVKTADGNITMTGNSEDASFNTVSGTIRVGDGTFERALMESVSGAISFSGDVAAGGAVNVTTHSGPVTLRVTPSAGAIDIDATSVGGIIADSATFVRPVQDSRGQSLRTIVGASTPSNPSAPAKGRVPVAVKNPGAVSAGTATITVKSYKGPIVVRR